MLTMEKLKEMKPGIFATGILTDPRLYSIEEMAWIAVRGGVPDWAIYYHYSSCEISHIKDYGDKCHDQSLIRELVPCDDDAFSAYRR